MLILLLILLTLFWLITLLAKNGLTTPYIAGAGAMTCCAYLQASPHITVIAVVLSYLIVFLLNEDVDPNQLLARGEDSSLEISNDPQLAAGMKVARVLVLVLFLFLPIPKPPGYMIGIVATLLIAILIWFNKDSWGRGSLLGFLILTMISVGIAAIACWGLRVFFSTNTPMLPLLAGLAIPNLIAEPKKMSLAERGLLAPPGALPVLFTFLLSWITPGLSLSAATSALIAPGVYRVLIANLTSCALEGWNLGLVIRSESASKTPLAELLLTPDRMYHSPLLDGTGLGYGMVFTLFLIAVLPAIMVYWFSVERGEPDHHVVLFIMVVQAFAGAGLSAIILIPLGLGIALLQRAIMPNVPEVRSLVIMSPMWVS